MMKGGALFCVLCMLCVLSALATLSENKCDPGSVMTKNGKCVQCDPGYFHSQESGMCLPCGFGQYSYKRGSVSCVRCHTKHSATHYMIGSTSCNHNEVLKMVGDGYNWAKNKVMEYVK